MVLAVPEFVLSKEDLVGVAWGVLTVVLEDELVAGELEVVPRRGDVSPEPEIGAGPTHVRYPDTKLTPINCCAIYTMQIMSVRRPSGPLKQSNHADPVRESSFSCSTAAVVTAIASSTSKFGPLKCRND